MKAYLSCIEGIVLHTSKCKLKGRDGRTWGPVLCRLVWVLFVLAEWIATLSFRASHIQIHTFATISVLIVIAAYSHWKVVVSDPGTVPSTAQPLGGAPHNCAWCKICGSFKPPKSHHDFRSNSCVSHMDHFCPWTNSVIGLRTQKHFLLFLVYTYMLALYLYVLFMTKLNQCRRAACHELATTSTTLMWVAVIAMVFVIFFVSYMLAQQLLGYCLGMGAIDRTKLSQEHHIHPAGYKFEPVPWEHIFGFGAWYTYPFPIDPDFREDEGVLGYHTAVTRLPAPALVPVRERAGTRRVRAKGWR